MSVYKGVYATFFLRARSKPEVSRPDPVLRYYKWWLGLFNTTRDNMVQLVRYKPFGARSKAFYKVLINNPDADLVVPAHPPEYYTELAKELGCSIDWVERRIKMGDSRVAVKLPVIAFPTTVEENVFALYAAALATYRNPSIGSRKLLPAVLEMRKWADWFGIELQSRFKDLRSSNYAFNGYKKVTRIGRAFRVLID